MIEPMEKIDDGECDVCHKAASNCLCPECESCGMQGCPGCKPAPASPILDEPKGGDLIPCPECGCSAGYDEESGNVTCDASCMIVMKDLQGNKERLFAAWNRYARKSEPPKGMTKEAAEKLIGVYREASADFLLADPPMQNTKALRSAHLALLSALIGAPQGAEEEQPSTKAIFLNAVWNTFDNRHACFTGDCDHRLQKSCDLAIGDSAREMVEEYFAPKASEAGLALKERFDQALRVYRINLLRWDGAAALADKQRYLDWLREAEEKLWALVAGSKPGKEGA